MSAPDSPQEEFCSCASCANGDSPCQGNCFDLSSDKDSWCTGCYAHYIESVEDDKDRAFELRVSQGTL